MISPASEVVDAERAVFDMGVASLALWPDWLAELATVAPPVAYNANGSIVLAHPSDAAELHQFYRDLKFHLGDDNRGRWLSRRELHELEPDLADGFEQALFLPDEACLDNRALLASLLDAIRGLGGECVANAPVQFNPEPHCEGFDLTGFQAVFDCRGVGARQSVGQLRGVRGEVLWVETAEVRLHRPVRLMHPRYKLYIVPKPNNRYIIGATEIESEDRSPVSVQSMLELCSALYTLNPAFAEARILELDANLRPATLDNLPLVLDSGEHPQGAPATRTITVNGLYRHGFLLAPYLVDRIVQQLKDNSPVTL